MLRLLSKVLEGLMTTWDVRMLRYSQTSVDFKNGFLAIFSMATGQWLARSLGIVEPVCRT